VFWLYVVDIAKSDYPIRFQIDVSADTLKTFAGERINAINAFDVVYVGTLLK
jgi:hypothetical protein